MAKIIYFLVLLSSTQVKSIFPVLANFFNQVNAADVTGTVPCNTWVWLTAGTSVTFTSPNYPSNYDFGHCPWVFRANTTDLQVQIDCSDFTLQNSFLGFCLDYLLLNLGGANINKYCGTNAPLNQVSQSQWVFAKFKASLFFHFKGFTCTATAVAA